MPDWLRALIVVLALIALVSAVALLPTALRLLFGG